MEQGCQNAATFCIRDASVFDDWEENKHCTTWNWLLLWLQCSAEAIWHACKNWHQIVQYECISIDKKYCIYHNHITTWAAMLRSFAFPYVTSRRSAFWPVMKFWTHEVTAGFFPNVFEMKRSQNMWRTVEDSMLIYWCEPYEEIIFIVSLWCNNALLIERKSLQNEPLYVFCCFYMCSENQFPAPTVFTTI